MSENEGASLAERLAEADARIADAAASAGRSPHEITRIVVTKFHPTTMVEELLTLGVRDVGESRQQELTSKRAEVHGVSQPQWHFIGQLQGKKARAVRAAADVVHSVDRERVADALHAAAPQDAATALLDVFLQVNLTDDPARGGAAPSEVTALAEHVAAHCGSLRVRGVMAVAPLAAAPAAAFERLHAAAADVRRVIPEARWMSAGMSGDFAEAIAAGATHLRIGSAITGPRPERG